MFNLNAVGNFNNRTYADLKSRPIVAILKEKGPKKIKTKKHMAKFAPPPPDD